MLFIVTALVTACAGTPPQVESYPAMAARRVTVHGAEIHYFDFHPDAPGRPIVFLHGYSGSGFEAMFFHDDLGSDRRLIAPDFPGAGLSDKPEIEYTLDYYVKFVEAFIHELELDEFDLVGHSMGGLVTTAYVASRDPTIDRLVLIAPLGVPGSAGAFNEFIARTGALVDVGLGLNNRTFMQTAMRMNVFHDPDALPPDLLDYLATASLHTPNGRGALASVTHNIIAAERDASLFEEIDVPTLIIWGENDDVLGSRFAPEVERRIRESELHLIAECGHMPHVEQSEITARLIREFLDRGRDDPETEPQPPASPEA